MNVQVAVTTSGRLIELGGSHGLTSCLPRLLCELHKPSANERHGELAVFEASASRKQLSRP